MLSHQTLRPACAGRGAGLCSRWGRRRGKEAREGPCSCWSPGQGAGHCPLCRRRERMEAAPRGGRSQEARGWEGAV